MNTILCVAPHFGLRVTLAELEDEMEETESEAPQPKKARSVTWLPALEYRNVDYLRREDLAVARKEVFTSLAGGSSVLACMSADYFRAFSRLLGGNAYSGRLSGGDAIVMHFLLQEAAAANDEGPASPTESKHKAPLMVLTSSKYISGTPA
jgi:hypothetical protein